MWLVLFYSNVSVNEAKWKMNNLQDFGAIWKSTSKGNLGVIPLKTEE